VNRPMHRPMGVCSIVQRMCAVLYRIYHMPVTCSRYWALARQAKTVCGQLIEHVMLPGQVWGQAGACGRRSSLQATAGGTCGHTKAPTDGCVQYCTGCLICRLLSRDGGQQCRQDDCNQSCVTLSCWLSGCQGWLNQSTRMSCMSD
jgi:hypothetical protein